MGDGRVTCSQSRSWGPRRYENVPGCPCQCPVFGTSVYSGTYLCGLTLPVSSGRRGSLPLSTHPISLFIPFMAFSRQEYWSGLPFLSQSILKEISPECSLEDWCWSETPVLWPPEAKRWLIGKDPDAGKDGRREEKRTIEDEMSGWHHRFNGHGFGWTPGVGDGQGGLVCWNSWGCRESDTTERLDWTELSPYSIPRLSSTKQYQKISACVDQTKRMAFLSFPTLIPAIWAQNPPNRASSMSFQPHAWRLGALLLPSWDFHHILIGAPRFHFALGPTDSVVGQSCPLNIMVCSLTWVYLLSKTSSKLH